MPKNSLAKNYAYYNLKYDCFLVAYNLALPLASASPSQPQREVLVQLPKSRILANYRNFKPLATNFSPL